MTTTNLSLIVSPTSLARVVATPTLTPRVGAVLLWLLLTLTTLDLSSRIESDGFAADWQTLLRLAVCTACGFYGLHYRRATLPQLWRFSGAWGVLLVGWALFTIPFSISPLYSAASVFAIGCVTLFVPALLVNLGDRRTIENVLNALLAFVALNWLLHFMVPPLGRSEFIMPDGEIMYRFGNDAQQLGLQAAWAIGIVLMLTVAGWRRWPGTLVLLAVLGLTLVLTQSRTAIITACAIVAVVWWQCLTVTQRFLTAILGLLIVAAIALVVAANLVPWDVEFLAEAISRSGEADEIQNFTGRTDVWQHAWEKIREAPYFGWGYGCSRFLMDDETRFSFVPYHAHNLLLNMALCTGLPGACLLLATIVHQLIRALLGAGALVSIATTFVVVAGLTEPVLYGPMPRSHTVIWLVALFWTQFGGTDFSRRQDKLEKALA